ncbi:hypothetical protein CJ469_06399 [Nocardia farcinica]|nr:hypothetical protein CJ469_06399 [Nocardia farcinica]PFW98820.1 hypothetical protein CJ468_06433 [Nocardia farcinica]
MITTGSGNAFFVAMIASAASRTRVYISSRVGVSSSAFAVYSWMLRFDSSAAAPVHAWEMEFWIERANVRTPWSQSWRTCQYCCAWL